MLDNYMCSTMWFLELGLLDNYQKECHIDYYKW